jgi:hypothetical protein
MSRFHRTAVVVALALVGCASAPVPHMVVDGGACTPAPTHVDLGVPSSTAHHGKVVVLLRSSGTPSVHGDLHPALWQALTDDGFTVVPVALDLAAVSTAARCDSRQGLVSCLARIATSLAKHRPDFVVATRYLEGQPRSASILAYDVHAATLVRELVAQLSDGDLVLPIVLPTATTRVLVDAVTPPPPPTEAELEILAEVARDPSPWVQRIALVEPGADAPILSWRRENVVVEMPLTDVLDDLREREDTRLLLLVKDVHEHGPSVLGSAWTDVLEGDDSRATRRMRQQQQATSLCPRDAAGGCRTTDVELHRLVGRMLDRGVARVYRCGVAKARWIDVARSPLGDENERTYSDAHGQLMRVR